MSHGTTAPERGCMVVVDSFFLKNALMPERGGGDGGNARSLIGRKKLYKKSTLETKPESTYSGGTKGTTVN